MVQSSRRINIKSRRQKEKYVFIPTSYSSSSLSFHYSLPSLPLVPSLSYITVLSPRKFQLRQPPGHVCRFLLSILCLPSPSPLSPFKIALLSIPAAPPPSLPPFLPLIQIRIHCLSEAGLRRLPLVSPPSVCPDKKKD